MGTIDKLNNKIMQKSDLNKVKLDAGWSELERYLPLTRSGYAN